MKIILSSDDIPVVSTIFYYKLFTYLPFIYPDFHIISLEFCSFVREAGL